MVGGYLYERLPRRTWMSGLPGLHAARTMHHHLGLGLGIGTVGLLLLTWAWWDLRSEVRGHEGGLSRVRLAVAVWAAPLMLAPPLFSGDGWSYVATGDLAGRGLSPYRWTPASLPVPLQSGVSPKWLDTPSPYGPLSLVWGGAFSHVTHDPWALLTWYRVLAVLSLVLMAWAVPVIARRAGRDPVDASWLAVASPFVLAHGIGGLHNDLTAAALMLAALAVARPGRWLPAAALVGVAAAVKSPGLVAAVGVVLLSVDTGAGWWPRLRRAAEVGAVAVAVLLAAGWLTGLGTGWIAALAVPAREHTALAITWSLGRWTRVFLEHTGTLGHHVVHVVHPALLAKKLGMVLLAGTAFWVVFVRRIGSPARALTGTGIVLFAAVLLSPEAHYWYFLWCLPLLACLVLPRPARAALVAGIITFGLTAPADGAVHVRWLMDRTALVIVLVPLVAWLLTARADHASGAREVSASGSS